MKTKFVLPILAAMLITACGSKPSEPEPFNADTATKALYDAAIKTTKEKAGGFGLKLSLDMPKADLNYEHTLADSVVKNPESTKTIKWGLNLTNTNLELGLNLAGLNSYSETNPLNKDLKATISVSKAATKGSVGYVEVPKSTGKNRTMDITGLDENLSTMNAYLSHSYKVVEKEQESTYYGLFLNANKASETLNNVAKKIKYGTEVPTDPTIAGLSKSLPELANKIATGAKYNKSVISAGSMDTTVTYILGVAASYVQAFGQEKAFDNQKTTVMAAIKQGLTAVTSALGDVLTMTTSGNTTTLGLSVNATKLNTLYGSELVTAGTLGATLTIKDGLVGGLTLSASGLKSKTMPVSTTENGTKSVQFNDFTASLTLALDYSKGSADIAQEVETGIGKPENWTLLKSF